MKLGAHMPAAGGVWRALERGAQVDCDVVQIFVKNNMQWAGRPFRPEELTRFAKERAARRFAVIFAHTGYLINIAGPAGPNRDRSIQSLIQEVELAASLDLPFLVLHPGAHLGQGEEKGLKQAAQALDEVFRATRKLPVRIALENTAGQGTCLGARLNHHAHLYQHVGRPERLGVCLDTCHFFAAGYDIRTPAGWETGIAEADDLFGLDQVLAFHLNDSKGGLGSRLDRHVAIGQGAIGRAGFAAIVNDARFVNHPGCLETPKSDDLHEDIENLAVLRSLVKPRRGRAQTKPNAKRRGQGGRRARPGIG